MDPYETDGTAQAGSRPRRWMPPPAGEDEESAAWYALVGSSVEESVCDWYDALARTCPPGVLDVGAGAGRVAIPLAERGHEVVCVEPSSGMRAALLARLADRPALLPRITVVPARAEDLDLDGYRAGLVTVLGVVHRLEGSGAQAFTVMRRHLHPDGRLVVILLPAAGPFGERELSRHRLGRTDLVTSVRQDITPAGLTRTLYSYRLLEGEHVRWEETSSSERDVQRSVDVQAALAGCGFEVVDEVPCTDWSATPTGTRLVLRPSP